MESFEILTVATNLGYLMLKHGAEVYRVEWSIKLILSAYGYKKVDIFAIPSTLTVSLVDKKGMPMSKTRTIAHGSYTPNLEKLDMLNSLSRQICQTKPSYKAIHQRIAVIQSMKESKLWARTLSYAVVGTMLCIFFGGGIREGAVAFVISAIICLLEHGIEELEATKFFVCIVCSGFAAFSAVMAVKFGFAGNSDKIIIGSLMNLVPGLCLTNCMRDFIIGDFMAGLQRLVEALMVATGIAIGVAIALTFSKNIM